MPKRPITEKQRAVLEHGRAVRQANLEAKRKAQASRERTLKLQDGDPGKDPPAPARKPRKRQPARQPEPTPEARGRGGFLGGVLDALRS